MTLNDTKCRNSKPKDTNYFLSDGKGLGLYVRTSGIKSWQYRYRNPLGKQQILTYGQYPAISLKDARERHMVNHQMVKDGIDPKLETKKKKQQQRHSYENTFEKVAREWHKKNVEKWRPKYAKTIMHRLETDIFPHIGAMPISEITTYTILDVMERIEKRGVYEVQRRALQYISKIFRYAIPKRLVERDLTIEIFDALRPSKKVEHRACIQTNEFPELLWKFYRNEGRCYDLTHLAFELIMHTFLRTQELIGGRWEEINWDKKQWIVPAERMKMDRQHIVPLSSQALDILQKLKNINGNREYIFASLIKPKQPISNNTILQVLYRMGYKNRMTGHGFRALATTVALENLKYPKHVTEEQLSHRKKDCHGEAYDRARYLDERTQMMQDWSNYINEQLQIGMKNKHNESAVFLS